MRTLIILFAKTPAPGYVKTRLGAAIGGDAAARLYRAFVADTIELVLTVPDVQVELHTDAPCDDWSEYGLQRRVQVPGDLGARMLDALKNGLNAGYSPVAILCTDAPTLPPSHIKTLITIESDVALGPTEDGGFYGICASKVDSAMFSGVTWSSPGALSQTMDAVAASGLRVALGPAWFDVDDETGVNRLRSSPVLPRHTGKVLDDMAANSNTATTQPD